MTEHSRTAENKIRDLRIVNEAAHVMIDLPDQESVFKYILDLISENHPGCIILLNQNDAEKNKVKVLDIAGVKKSLFKKGIQILGFSPIGKEFPLKPNIQDYLEKENLQKNKDGFPDLVKGYVPSSLVDPLIELFRIKDVYHLGLIKEQRIFAELQFYFQKDSPGPKRHLIETIANIASSIIHKREIEKNLIKSQIQFRNLILQSNDGIIISDHTGNITEWNRAMSELTGIRKNEIIGKKTWDIQLDPSSNDKRTYFTEEEKEQIKQLYHTYLNFRNTEWFREPQTKEIKTKNGNIKFIELSIFPIKSEDNNYSVSAIIRDITNKVNYERKILEQSKTLKELNSTKDKFFSIIGHDLKSPLANIVGFIEILRGEIGKDQEVALNIIKNIERSAYKVSELLDNLLQWSRIQTGSITCYPETFELCEVYHENCELFSETAEFKDIELICPETESIFVKADKNMVNTIFRNLINNAIKFTSSGGKVEISIEKRKKDVEIKITDTGYGIPEEKMKALFKPEKTFSSDGTDHEKGSGIGLVLCKEFVEMNKGIIGVKSEEGKGSEFFFTLLTA